MLSRRILTLLPRHNRQVCLSVSNEVSSWCGSQEGMSESQPSASPSQSIDVFTTQPESFLSPTQLSTASSGAMTSLSHTSPFSSLRPSPRLYSSVATTPQPSITSTAGDGVGVKSEGVVDMEHSSLTPSAVVALLDKYIVGQEDAKKAVAVAFRNRWRRHRVAESIRDDIVPKNLLLIGPTGCGKTEIARRLAKLANAPFVKVEATKFTEIGYHGRDVDTIIRDLVDNSITLVKQRLKDTSRAAIQKAVEIRLIKLILGNDPDPLMYENVERKLLLGEMECHVVDVDIPTAPSKNAENPNATMMPVIIQLDRFMAGGGRKERKRLKISEARPILEEAEVEKQFPNEVIIKEAIKLAEQDGIVFIDEIDKIVSSRNRSWSGTDPSSEGVQRDLLPIIEGSVVSTKHGNVSTDHILFICAGAFHSCKPSDLMAELQGRLPIRVELKALSRSDFVRILKEPEYNLIRQQKMLLATEGVDIQFTDEAVEEIARVAEEVNKTVDNIGARRLHSVLERIVEEVSFDAPALAARARAGGGLEFHKCVVDKAQVEARVLPLLKRQDLSRYII